MKECFCFLFGLIVGIGSIVVYYRWLMSTPIGRVGFLRVLHDSFPHDYHSICDMPVTEEVWKP